MVGCETGRKNESKFKLYCLIDVENFTNFSFNLIILYINFFWGFNRFKFLFFFDHLFFLKR